MKVTLLEIIVFFLAASASAQTPDGATPLSNVRETIERAISKGPLAKDYEVSFHLNPFYLRGDFNGDGEVDIAVLVKQRSTRKVGIAIIHGGTSKIAILGAGAPLGNGGDDFTWMDYWQVYPKGYVARGTGKPRVPPASRGGAPCGQVRGSQRANSLGWQTLRLVPAG
jgi:hypothetical protein